MHVATLERLRCPECRAALRLERASAWTTAERVRHGVVGCGCERTYPIQDGILDLQPSLRGITPAQASNHVSPAAWLYEPLWRRGSVSLMSGEYFPLGREFEILIDWLQPGDGLYLDLACSTALYARALAADAARRGTQSRIIALDFSLPMLYAARCAIDREGWQTIDLVRADAESLPVATDALDGIVCAGSLNEFRAAWPVLIEARRALSPAGRAVFLSLVAASSPRGARFQALVALLSGIKFWSRTEFIDLCTSAGWHISAVEQWGSVQFSVLESTLRKPSINT